MQNVLDAWVARVVLLVVHGGCFLAIWTGISWPAALVCLGLYLLRGFAITGGYHRLFAHKSYKTYRWFQSVLAIIGTTALEGGVLKWAKEHRHHHKESDEPEDLHSPRKPRNFWWSHLGWILSRRMPDIKTSVRDLEKYPELIWIDRLQLLWIGLLIAGLYGFGEYLGAAWGTSGLQMVVVGFFFSTVITWHITWCVNSVTHTFGSRRFETEDDSRNNWIIGILALGEGHHNNHHAHPGVCRQGLLWWEFDPTYYVLKLLSYLRITWDLNEPEPEVFAVARSLGRIRRNLEKQNLEPSTLVQRMKTGQEMLASAVRKASRARKAVQELFSKQLISKREKGKRISGLREVFRAQVGMIEAHCAV